MKRQLVELNDGTTKREIVIECLADCEAAVLDPALSWLMNVEYQKTEHKLTIVKEKA